MLGPRWFPQPSPPAVGKLPTQHRNVAGEHKVPLFLHATPVRLDVVHYRVDRVMRQQASENEAGRRVGTPHPDDRARLHLTHAA